MTDKYPAQNLIVLPAFPTPISRRVVDPVATRAIELLDVLHHSEDGHVLLPLYGGCDPIVREEVDKNLKAAELLVRTRTASWARSVPAGRRLRLAGVEEIDGPGNYSQAERSTSP